MSRYPKAFDGRQTTKEEWDAYEMELANHKAGIQNKRDLLKIILDYVEMFGIEDTRSAMTKLFDYAESMDAPNKPGYYRANND